MIENIYGQLEGLRNSYSVLRYGIKAVGRKLTTYFN